MKTILNALRAISPFQGGSGSGRDKKDKDKYDGTSGGDPDKRYRDKRSGSTSSRQSRVSNSSSVNSSPALSRGSPAQSETGSHASSHNSGTIRNPVFVIPNPPASKTSYNNSSNRPPSALPPKSASNNASDIPYQSAAPVPQASNSTTSAFSSTALAPPNKSPKKSYPNNDFQSIDMTDVDFYVLLELFYSKYNPSKKETIRIVLSEYRGDEIELLEGLMKRYKVHMGDMEYLIGKSRTSRNLKPKNAHYSKKIDDIAAYSSDDDSNDTDDSNDRRRNSYSTTTTPPPPPQGQYFPDISDEPPGYESTDQEQGDAHPQSSPPVYESTDQEDIHDYSSSESEDDKGNSALKSKNIGASNSFLNSLGGIKPINRNRPAAAVKGFNDQILKQKRDIDGSEASVSLKDLLRRSQSADQNNKRVAEQMQALKFTQFDQQKKSLHYDRDDISPSKFTQGASVMDNPLIQIRGDNIIYDGVELRNSTSLNSGNKGKAASHAGSKSPKARGDNLSSKLNTMMLDNSSDDNDDIENILSSGFQPKNAQTFEKILNTPIYKASSAVKAALKLKSALKKKSPEADKENFNPNPAIDFRTGSHQATLKYDYSAMYKKERIDMRTVFINWFINRRAAMLRSKLHANALAKQTPNKISSDSSTNFNFIIRLREFFKDPTCVNNYRPYSNAKKSKSKTNKRIWTIWIEKRHPKRRNLTSLKAKPLSKAVDGESLLGPLAGGGGGGGAINLANKTPSKDNSRNEDWSFNSQPAPKTPMQIKDLVANPLSKSNYKKNRPQEDELDLNPVTGVVVEKEPFDLEKEKMKLDKEVEMTISDGLHTKARLIESLCKGEALLNLLADILGKTKSGSSANAGQIIEYFLAKRGFPGNIYGNKNEHAVGARLLAAMKDDKFTKQCIQKYKGRFLATMYSEISEYNANDFVAEDKIEGSADLDSSDDINDIVNEEKDDDDIVDEGHYKQIEQLKQDWARKDLSKMNIDKTELFEYQNLTNMARINSNVVPLFAMPKKVYMSNAENGELLDNVASSSNAASRASSNGSTARKNGEKVASNNNNNNNNHYSNQSNPATNTATKDKSVSARKKEAPTPLSSYYNPKISNDIMVKMDDLETVATVLKVNYDLPKYMAYTEGAIKRIIPDTKEIPVITSGGLLSPNKKALANMTKTPVKFHKDGGFDGEKKSRYLQLGSTTVGEKAVETSPRYEGHNLIISKSKAPTGTSTGNLGDKEWISDRKLDENPADDMTLELPEEVRRRIATNFNTITGTNGMVIPPARSVSRNRMVDFGGNNVSSGMMNSSSGSGSTSSSVFEKNVIGEGKNQVDDWKAKFDSKTSRTYYYSPSRRASTWDVDKYERKQSIDSAAATPTTSGSSLAVSGIANFSRRGSPNSKNLKSVLNSPSKNNGIAATTINRSDVAMLGYSSLTFSPNKIVSSVRSASPVPLAPAPIPALAVTTGPFATSMAPKYKSDEASLIDKNGDEWVKKLDNATHRFYWYSKAAKKSSWYPPIV